MMSWIPPHANITGTTIGFAISFAQLATLSTPHDEAQKKAFTSRAFDISTKILPCTASPVARVVLGCSNATLFIDASSPPDEGLVPCFVLDSVS